LAVIALLQLAALGYGLWTVFTARPVHLVFEYYRFAVVHAVDVPPELVAATPAEVDALPLTGPTMLSIRSFKSADEQGKMTLQALGGLSLAARPDLWQPYAAALPEIQKEAKPVVQLKSRFPGRAAEIDQLLAPFGAAAQSLVYLPVVGRKSFWTAVLDPATAEVKAFLPLDSF
jgi:hypothetical protein